MTGSLKSTKGKAIAEEAIAAFTSSLEGQAIAPGDPDYEIARRIWNASIDRHPGLIVRCASAGDVVKSVAFGRDNDILLAVRGGGHNVGGRALCDDGLVIDLSAMRDIQVDPSARIVKAQAGCTLGDLDQATHAHGLTVPVGVVSKTGIAGLTLGGGVGWLVRKYGLTCDNVVAFEVVTADGRLLTASATDNYDLFWGLRGGGGNFGVVVRFTYKAYPISTVLGGLLVHTRDKAGEVLPFYRDFMASAPDELTAYAGLMYSPDGDPITGIIACWCGDQEAGEKALQPLRAFGPPVMDAIQPMAFPAMQSMLDDAFPEGTHNYWKSTFVRELSDPVIDMLVEHANKVPSPMSAVVIELYGGAASRVSDTDTAFAHRKAEYDIGIMSQWTDPADRDRNIAWARELFDALRPYSSGAFLLNFLGQEEEAVVRAAFGHNYDRLAQLKNKYDPHNLFRQNQNIRPAGAGGT
jgi:FAD binding domain/Berberine and berberine like